MVCTESLIMDVGCGEVENFGRNIVVEVQSIEDDGMTMEFDIVGVMASVVNALRRALLVEVRLL